MGAVGDQVTRSDPWRQAGAARYGILEATASWKLLVRGEVDNQQDDLDHACSRTYPVAVSLGQVLRVRPSFTESFPEDFTGGPRTDLPSEQ
jgi:hypothetical protein